MKKLITLALVFVLALAACASIASADALSTRGVNWYTSPSALQRLHGHTDPYRNGRFAWYSYQGAVPGRNTTLKFIYHDDALVLTEYFFYYNNGEDPFVRTLNELERHYGQSECLYNEKELTRILEVTGYMSPQPFSPYSWVAADGTRIYLFFELYTFDYSVLFVEPEYYWMAMNTNY